MSTLEDIFIPDLGADKDVDIIDIMVKIGDTVEAEEGLITLETEKASMDVPAPFGGKIVEILLKVGDKVNSGDLLARMTKTAPANEKTAPPVQEMQVEQEKQEAPKKETLHTPIATPSTENPSSMTSHRATKIYASPSVRKLAREFGVDLGFVNGTAKKGRILKEDVKAYVKEQLSGSKNSTSGGIRFDFPPIKEIDFGQFGETQTVPLSKIQKISGPTLHRNWVMMPHVTQFDECDITELEKFRKEQNALNEGVKLSPLVFALKATAKALALHPTFNASLSPDGQYLIMKKYINIGIAVDTPNGLVVPVIKGVDTKGFKQIAQEMAELSAKAREGKLKPTDMQGGSFSISSLGGIGGTYFTPIINAPEVAILGLSKAQIKPMWDGNGFVPRLMLPLSLSYNHKVIDGADGARFTTTLARLLSDIRLVCL